MRPPPPTDGGGSFGMEGGLAVAAGGGGGKGCYQSKLVVGSRQAPPIFNLKIIQFSHKCGFSFAVGYNQRSTRT